MLDMEARKELAELLARASDDYDYRIANDGACIEVMDGVEEVWTEVNDVEAAQKFFGEFMALKYKIDGGIRFLNASIMPLVAKMYEDWLSSGEKPEAKGVQFSAKARRILADLLGKLKGGLGHGEGKITIIKMGNETVYWSDDEALVALFDELGHKFRLQARLMAFAEEWHLFDLLHKEAMFIPKFSIAW